MTRRVLLCSILRLVTAVPVIFNFRWTLMALECFGGWDKYLPLIFSLIAAAIFFFAGTISKFIIFEDGIVNKRLMLKRFIISAIFGIGIFAWEYISSYPQRAGFYERTHYPPVFLTINAIMAGCFVTFAVFILWYIIVHIYDAMRYYLAKKNPASNDNSEGEPE